MKSIFHAFLALTVCAVLMVFYQQPAVLYNTYDFFAGASVELANSIMRFCESNSSQIYLFTLTVFGSLLVPIFSPSGKCDRTSLPFLRVVLPGRGTAFYNRLDFCITVLVGTVLGFLVIHPTAALDAIGAGAGWSILLSRVFKIGTKSRTDSDSNDTSGPSVVP
jgi:hypothetical protein